MNQLMTVGVVGPTNFREHIREQSENKTRRNTIENR
jgi:hypothetical protein